MGKYVIRGTARVPFKTVVTADSPEMAIEQLESNGLMSDDYDGPEEDIEVLSVETQPEQGDVDGLH